MHSVNATEVLVRSNYIKYKHDELERLTAEQASNRATLDKLFDDQMAVDGPGVALFYSDSHQEGRTPVLVLSSEVNILGVRSNPTFYKLRDRTAWNTVNLFDLKVWYVGCDDKEQARLLKMGLVYYYQPLLNGSTMQQFNKRFQEKRHLIEPILEQLRKDGWPNPAPKPLILSR